MLENTVCDTDFRFKINPISREISNATPDRNKLVQYDHNSERFTFEIPKVVDGFDISACNKVEVHYINIYAKDKTATKRGVYAVEDFQTEEENAVFSWLISGNATQYKGSLNFLIKFAVCGENGKVSYKWHTKIFTGIVIKEGMDNGEVIVEEYADVLEQWKQELFADVEELEARIRALEKKEGPVEMRIGIPLTLKDPKINFDTTAKTITWGVNFFVEYNNINHVIAASTISYADVGNVVYFCYNLKTEAVELTAPAGYDPENQVVVFAFVVTGLKSWDYACTLPIPYMVNGQYVRVAESVDIPDGDRTVTLNPGEDIQAAVDAGYTTIVLHAGNYPAIPVTVRDKNSIRFVVPDAGYDRRKMKKNAVIDNSIDLQVAQSGDLLTADFQAPTESNWYKVFVSKTLPPERTGLRSTTYNAILWETDAADNGNDTKLIPVLTMEECASTVGSFYYSHIEGKVYINPLNARDTNVYKRLQVEEGALFSIVNVNLVYMENIEVKYPPQYLNLNTISDLTAVSCVVSHTAYEGGFKVNGVNGIFRDCEAYKVCADGFGIGGDLNGYTEYFNCSGHHCYDDGISHHNGSAGAIYGGVWHHNGKAGVAPAHGSVVNVYDAVAHNNSTGFYSKSDATVPEAMGREAHYFNCVAYNNRYGIGVKNYHVKAYGCQFKDNAWKDTIVDSDSDTAYTSLTIMGDTEGVTDEQIQNAVGAYLTENPLEVEAGIPIPNTAQIGQTIVVKAVDETGKPTEWEAANLPSGDEAWERIAYGTLEAESSIYITKDIDGKPFELTKAVFITMGGFSNTSGARVYPNDPQYGIEVKTWTANTRIIMVAEKGKPLRGASSEGNAANDSRIRMGLEDNGDGVEVTDVFNENITVVGMRTWNGQAVSLAGTNYVLYGVRA